MPGRTPYLGDHTKVSKRTPYLGTKSAAATRTAYTGSAPQKKSGGHSLLGEIAKYSGAQFAGNLVKDIGETGAGVGVGLYGIGKAAVLDEKDALQGKSSHRFIDIGKGALAQEKDYYGHDLGHHLYTHPVQAIVDALTIADLGAGALAKTGVIKAGRDTVVTRSPRNIATGKGPVHTDITSAKPLVRGREKIAANARAKHPEGLKVGPARIGGETKLYGKQIQQQANQNALHNLAGFSDYQKATKGLKEREWAALHIRAMDIHPDELAKLWKGTPAEKWVTDPAVQKLVLSPPQRLLGAEAAARSLSEQGAALLKNKLKDETVAARPALTKQQASDALGHQVQEIHGQPYYFPHTIENAKPVSPLAASGGGKGIPKKLGSMRQNTGALALSGKLHLRTDVLGPEFLRRVKYVKYDEIHNALVRGAVRVSRADIESRYGGKLPQGYEYIRAKPSSRIPATIRGEGDQHIPIEKLIPNAEDLHDSQLARDGFSTVDAAQAHTSGGNYYIVPKSTVKAATGEFTKTSDFTRAFVKRPLAVWRAAVLGLRVGFLTNNLVGNSVMYAVRTGGQGALRDLFGAILETHGRETALKVLRNQATPPDVRTDLYREFFPEQVHGTFGRTQSPATSPAHIAGQKTVETLRTATGAIPKLTSKVAEEVPRRALIRNMIRNSPEFKRVYASLPKQTRSFENAARQILEGKGGKEYQRYISKQVNRALGDYLNLSAVERNVLRNLLPFYSWYRAIVTTTTHLAVDTPLRANILGQIGRIGKEQSDQALGAVPSFLEDAIPLGNGPNGTKRVLSTQGLNPYATLQQLGRGSTSDLSNLGLNPFLMAGLETYAAAANKQHSYYPSVSPGQLLAKALSSVVTSLPPAQLVSPTPPSRLYPNRDRKSTIFSQLGAPVKEYNPSVAAQQAARGR